MSKVSKDVFLSGFLNQEMTGDSFVSSFLFELHASINLVHKAAQYLREKYTDEEEFPILEVLEDNAALLKAYSDALSDYQKIRHVHKLDSRSQSQPPETSE